MTKIHKQNDIGDFYMENLGRDALKDIQDIKVNTDLPVNQRINNYISDIGNPYYYKCGDITVRVRFQEDGETLENTLKEYIKSL